MSVSLNNFAPEESSGGLGHKLPYDSKYDSDSDPVVSENQALSVNNPGQ